MNPHESKLNAVTAIRNRLYVPGWMLRGMLKTFADGEQLLNDSARCVLSFDDNQPIGVGVILSPPEDFYMWIRMKWPDRAVNDVNFMAMFVRPTHRRKGHATKMYNRLSEGQTRPVTATSGIDCSHDMWKKFGVDALW